MSKFWKLRLSTLVWGFAVSLVFTGNLFEAGWMFGTMVLGNTIIMYYLA